MTWPRTASREDRSRAAHHPTRTERGLIITRRGRGKKASTLYTDKGRVERHIKPLLGTRTVKDLTPADLRGFLRDVIAGKTAADVKTKKQGRAIVKGGRGTGTRTFALLSSILSYAVAEGYRLDNPARGIVLPSIVRRKARLDANQYQALGAALAAAEERGEAWQAVEAARLLALTGCRAGEVVGLKPAECDVAGSCLRFGDTKTGESVRVGVIPSVSHDVPPGAQGSSFRKQRSSRSCG